MTLDLKIIVLNICKSSFTNTCKYVKKFPAVSGISFTLLLLYFFAPSVLVFLVYASPLIVIAAGFLFHHLRSKPQTAKKNGIKQEKKIEKKLSTLGKSRSVANDRPAITKPTRSMSQRRNKEKFFVEADPVISHDIKASLSDFLREVRNKRAKESEAATAKKNQEGEELGFPTNPKSEIESTSLNLIDSGSSEDDKGVVEWNEDDQKNLMDLGISEMERNRRLESLIARRRSRKFYKMNSEKGMIVDIEAIAQPCSSPMAEASSSSTAAAVVAEIIAPVLISTGIDDPLVVHGSGDDQIPGSAPSILLPGKNPFDLPYDPHEEKPDLMADSFQQEFAVDPHKETVMCRHESFSLGHSMPKLHPAGNFDEGNGKPPRHVDPIARTVSVTDLVTDLLEPRQPDESPNKAPGEMAAMTNAPKDSNIDQGFEISINPRPPTLPRPIPKAASASDLSNDASLSIIHNARVDEHYQNKGAWHTPTNSVASDLQVEVSEVGSPPSTVDTDDDDRHDGGSLTYDGDVEKEVNSGSEELWSLSPHAPRIGKHELALRFLNEASEEGMIEAGLAEMKKNDDMDGDVTKFDKTEELKSVERETIYEIRDDDVSKPVEELVAEEPNCHIERELLQGPEKMADVIVKRNERVDGDSSNSVGSGGVESFHHSDIPTTATETSRLSKDVEDSAGDSIRDENVHQIYDEIQPVNVMLPSSLSGTSSSVQPEVVMDHDLADSNSLLSPVSVLVDTNQHEAQTSPSPIGQQMLDMDDSAHHLDQTPTNRNEQGPSGSFKSDIDSMEESSDNVIGEGNEGKEPIPEPESLNSIMIPSEDFETQSLSVEKQEPIMELVDGDITEPLRQDAIAELVKASDLISEQTLEGESLSSVKQESIAKSLKQDDVISTESILGNDQSMSSLEEAITSMKLQEPVVNPFPLLTAEGDSLSAIQQEASIEPVKTENLMPSEFGIQTQIVHIEPSQPNVESGIPSSSISQEQDQLVDMDREHNVSQTSKDKIDIHHQHLPDLNPLVGQEQVETHQSSDAVNGDDGEEKGTSAIGNRQDDLLVVNSNQPSDENMKQHEMIAEPKAGDDDAHSS